MKNYQVLVIGGGPAGITLAKNLGKKMSVGIIRPEDNSMIYCAMPYAIENLIPVEKTLKKDSLVTDAGADLIRGRVKGVNFKKKSLLLESGEEIFYEKLVIATGADPILPEIPGVDLEGVYTFKTRENLDSILAEVNENKISSALVVGAGAIGIELSQALNARGIKTRLVDMAGSVLPNLIDAEYAGILEEELKNAGIEVILSAKVSELHGGKRIDTVSLDNGNNIKLDGGGIVVFAVGMKPSVKIFSGAELDIGKQGIIVNEKMETNIKDVYAVGDCVQFRSAITGEIIPGKLATNAVPMARMLAKNLLGANRTYKGFYNGSATKVGKFFVGGTGFTEKYLCEKGYDLAVGNSEFTTTFPIMPGAKKIKTKIIADKKSLKILGGQVLSGSPVTDRVDLITMAIQYGLTVRDLVSFSYSAQPYQSFFPANHSIVACCEDILSKVNP